MSLLLSLHSILFSSTHSVIFIKFGCLPSLFIFIQYSVLILSFQVIEICIVSDYLVFAETSDAPIVKIQMEYDYIKFQLFFYLIVTN